MKTVELRERESERCIKCFSLEIHTIKSVLSFIYVYFSDSFVYGANTWYALTIIILNINNIMTVLHCFSKGLI